MSKALQEINDIHSPSLVHWGSYSIHSLFPVTGDFSWLWLCKYGGEWFDNCVSQFSQDFLRCISVNPIEIYVLVPQMIRILISQERKHFSHPVPTLLSIHSRAVGREIDNEKSCWVSQPCLICCFWFSSHVIRVHFLCPFLITMEQPKQLSG